MSGFKILVIITGLILLIITSCMFGYGIVLMQNNYVKTTCFYKGYKISNIPCLSPECLSPECLSTKYQYSGYLLYQYSIYNGTVVDKMTDRITNRITDKKLCFRTQNDAVNYFESRYNNDTNWNCWYDQLIPFASSVYFHYHYYSNSRGGGIIAIILGSIMVLVYLAIGIPLLITYMKDKYKRIQYDKLNPSIPLYSSQNI